MAENIMKLGMVLSATDKLSRVVDSAVNKSTSKMKNFEKAANRMGKSMQKIGAGMTAAGGAITGTLFADVTKMTEKAKQLEFTAQKIGIGVEEFQKLGFAASKSGIEVDRFELAMAKLSKTQVTAAMGNKAASKIFAMSGVSIYGANGKLKTTESLIKDLSDKFHKAKDGPTKTAMAMMIFGKAGKDMIPLLNKGGKAIDEMGEKMKKAGAYISKDQVAAFKKYRQAVGATKLQLEGMKMQIAIAVLPTAIKWAKAIENLTSRLTTWIGKHKTLFTWIVTTTGAIGAILTVLGTFTIVVGTVMRSIATFTAMNMALGLSFAKLQSRIWYTGQIIKGFNIAQKASAMWTAITTSSVWAFTAALLANPITWIVVGIAALIAVLVVCWKKFAAFRAVIKTTWEVIKGFGTILKDYVMDRIRGIIEGLGSMGKAIGLLFKGHFKDATSEALKGVKALSGYDATMKAMNSTKTLTGKISQTYSGILKQEQAAQKGSTAKTAMQTQQVKATSNVVNASQVATGATVNYSPVVNIASGTPQDKENFAQMLKAHKKEIGDIITGMNNNRLRTSFV